MAKKELTVREMASLGGKARKKKLSPERRKQIAKAAIAARWSKSKKKAVPKSLLPGGHRKIHLD